MTTCNVGVSCMHVNITINIANNYYVPQKASPQYNIPHPLFVSSSIPSLCPWQFSKVST